MVTSISSKLRWLFLILLFPALAHGAAYDLPGLTNHSRIVLLGDSISDAKKWTHYVSAYLINMHPQFTLHCQTEGRGGDTLEGLFPPGGDRYDRRVWAYQNQASNMFVFSMFGKNGSDTSNQFYTSYCYVVTNHIIATNNAVPILVSMHPNNVSNGGGFGDREDATTAAATNSSAANARIWRGLTNIWENNVVTGAPGSSTPTVHPGSGGHIMIAYETLKLLGFDTNVSTATINGSAITVTATNHCFVSSLSGTSSNITFTRLDDRLPWAFDEDGRAEAETLMPELVGWQNYGLTVSGLSSGTYDIKIDGSLVATATHTALAAGVNMSTWNQGPIFNQLQEVLGRIRDCHWVLRNDPSTALPNPAQGVQKYRSNCDAYYNPTNTPAAYFALLAPALTQIQNFDASIHTACQPVARTFTIVNQSGGGGGGGGGGDTVLRGRSSRRLLVSQ